VVLEISITFFVNVGGVVKSGKKKIKIGDSAMGCIYENNGIDEDGGRCTLCDEGDWENGPPGQENGFCVCSDDPDPSFTCDSYESDNVCYDCGVDLNVEDCQCVDEE
jgi:hypothetical protein